MQSLCLYGLPSFLSLKTDLALPSQIQNGICHHENGLDTTYDGSIRILDYMREGCLVRYIQSTKPLVFRLSFPSYCIRHRFPACQINRKTYPSMLLTIPTGTPTPDGFCTAAEHRMLITLYGECVFSENGEQILVDTGRCALLFVTGKADTLALTAANCIDSLKNIEVRYEKAYPESTAWDTLCQLTTMQGGTISSYEDSRVFLADMPLAGMVFLQNGAVDRAKSTAVFLLSHLEKHGYLPLVMHAQYPLFATEETGSERVHYPAVCHFFLDLAEKVDSALARRLKNTALFLFEKTKTAIKENSLPFSGTEFSIRNNTLLPSFQLYKNPAANAQYVHLAKRLNKASCTPVPSVADHCRKEFSQNLLSHPPKAYTRLPKTVYGFCKTCKTASYMGWLYRNESNVYLCPKCLKERKGTCASSGSLTLPLGEHAVFAENLYRAGCIGKDEFHARIKACSDHVTPQTSFYDLALLFQYDFSKRPKEKLLANRNTPLCAAEAAVCLLSNQKSEMP